MLYRLMEIHLSRGPDALSSSKIQGRDTQCRHAWGPINQKEKIQDTSSTHHTQLCTDHIEFNVMRESATADKKEELPKIETKGPTTIGTFSLK